MISLDFPRSNHYPSELLKKVVHLEYSIDITIFKRSNIPSVALTEVEVKQYFPISINLFIVSASTTFDSSASSGFLMTASVVVNNKKIGCESPYKDIFTKLPKTRDN